MPLLIPDTPKVKPVGFTNLHSTMPLLIPLLLIVPDVDVVIYIPLCLYLYEREQDYKRFKTLFTFHYASTYTLYPDPDSLKWAIFTFHYASTYTHDGGGTDCKYH